MLSVAREKSARNRRPNRLAAIFALSALVFLASGCGQAADEVSAAPSQPTPQAIDPVALAALPEATTFGTVESAPTDPAPEARTGELVVHPEDEVPVYEAKGGTAIATLPTTQLGSPTWLPVIEQDADWYHVLLPSRPNNSTGWISAADGEIAEASNDFRIEVDLANFALRVFEADTEIGDWTVGVGSSEAPTPVGRTFLLASIEETVSEFSPFTLPLGAHSDSFETYSDGPATVAIHGWPDETPFGTETSDGCIRVPDDALELLLTLPLGTVVDVS